MTRSKWLASLAFGALLAGGAYLLLRSRAPEPSFTPSAPGTLLRPDGNVRAVNVREETEEFRAAPKGKRIEELYRKESARIGAIDPDPQLTEQRLAAVVAELDSDEIVWLKDRALSPDTEGDARFFAAYLLALSSVAGGEPSLTALREIALAPVPRHKNQSLVELERQIRAQAVEGLSRARGQPAARDALLDVVAQQPDEFLRDRAHRGIHAWQTGKPVEEQDREALGKILYKK